MSLGLKKRYLMSLVKSAEPKIVLGVSGLYQSAPALTRTDDAVGMSWSMENNEIISDFDNVFPYNEMVRETIDGNVMVYVPEMYWRFEKSAEDYIKSVAVSNQPFTAGANEVVGHTNAFYYGAYRGSTENSVLKSKSGVAVQYNKTRPQFRTLATAGGSNYQIIDVWHTRILEMLWLIEFATKNQESVMVGYTSFGGQCGATDSLTKPSGQLGASNRMRYRYIEDFVGNGFELFDGITGHYVSNDPAQYNDTQVGAQFSGVGIDSGSLNLRAIGFADESKPLLIVPKLASGSTYTTYFCDAVLCSVNTTAYFRGKGAASSHRGLFNWAYISVSGTGGDQSCRIVKRI